MKHLPKVGTIVFIKRTKEVGAVASKYDGLGTDYQFVKLKGQPYRFISAGGLRYATPVEKLRYKLSGS